MNDQIECRYGPGKVDRANSEGYADPTAHDALMNIKKREYMPLVYICSPYAGNVEANVKAAKRYSRFAVLERNAIAFAPHLLFPQFLSDSDPGERDLALFMNKVFLGKADELWVFGSTRSKGMQWEIDKATKWHMKIRYFTEECEEIR